jgi:hypothetical protein
MFTVIEEKSVVIQRISQFFYALVSFGGPGCRYFELGLDNPQSWSKHWRHILFFYGV